jgi:hypothetical protein
LKCRRQLEVGEWKSTPIRFHDSLTISRVALSIIHVRFQNTKKIALISARWGI